MKNLTKIAEHKTALKNVTLIDCTEAFLLLGLDRGFMSRFTVPPLEVSRAERVTEAQMFFRVSGEKALGTLSGDLD